MEERWNRYLDALESRLLKVEDFAAEQIPDVAREWLSWEFWSSLAIGVGFVLLALVFLFAYKKSVQFFHEVKDAGGDGDLPAMLCVFSILCVPVFLGLSIYFGFNTVKVQIAPKVVLLEKLAEIVKGKK